MRFALVALLAVATVSGLQVQTARRGAPCAVRALDSRIAAGPADDGAQTPDTLSYVLGAGALSTASYGLVGASDARARLCSRRAVPNPRTQVP